MRPSDRQPDQLRDISFLRNFTNYAEGSVLSCYGNTKVLCNASVSTNLPKFLKGKGQGWITAEYAMLPRSTHSRNDREASRGKQGGRTLEIQRLIGRSLRTCVELRAIGEHSITLDCDVIQADGGTRTAAISGATVALHDALSHMHQQGMIKKMPEFNFVAAVSVGIYKNTPILDLEYVEDSSAETDMNVVMNQQGQFIEIQGTAEGHPFNQDELSDMLGLAKTGISQILAAQQQVLS